MSHKPMPPIYLEPAWEKRFWALVKKAGPDECWIWQGNRNDTGYGYINVGALPRRVSRLVMQIQLGRELRDEELVLHSCDVPACANPGHLRLGTHAENMADRSARGRHRNNAPKAQATKRKNKRLAAIAAYFGGAK